MTIYPPIYHNIPEELKPSLELVISVGERQSKETDIFSLFQIFGFILARCLRGRNECILCTKLPLVSRE